MVNKVFVCLVFFLTAIVAFARPEHFPATTPDGLQLLPDTQLRAVYIKPGADLREYDKVSLMETQVSFARNWQRKENEDALAQNRISDKDMKQIRDKVAREFARELGRELSADGRRIVSGGGSGVLILRPAIIDLEMTVPDLDTPGMNKSLVASAASMTLYLELYDGKTGAIVARIIDPEATNDNGMAEVSDRVTFTAEFDGIVRRWARILNSHLAHLTRR